MALDFAGDYASPQLRKAIFDRIHGGSEVVFEVITIEEAFPPGFRDSGAPDYPPTHAVRCTIIAYDGTSYQTCREIDRQEYSKKTQRWSKQIPMTPQYLAASQTKAMGRTLRDAGMPQKRIELQELMRWWVALDGRADAARSAAATTRRIDAGTGEIMAAEIVDPDDGGDPDAGADDHLTPEQELAERVSALPGPLKAQMAHLAKDIGVKNLLRAGDEAQRLLDQLDDLLEAQRDAEGEPE